MTLFPIILAGGHGSRFWPVSRESKPKQFLSISETGESLIQATEKRLLELCKPEQVSVVTNALHKNLVFKHLPKCNIMVEPLARNTAAAIGLAAIKVLKKDPKAIMLVLPADHYIQNIEVLHKSWQQAINLAKDKDLLVTLGIQPTSPHTGYGYIKRGEEIDQHSFKVAKFVEKPFLQKAITYLESGNYSWNSGMFVWKASTILTEIGKWMPELYKALEAIKPHLDTNREFDAISTEFNTLQTLSIDVGVLEFSTQCAVVPVPQEVGWSDVGSWDVWADHFPKDAKNNTVHAYSFLDGVENSIISTTKFTAILGLSNIIVIETEDALLIADKEKAQDVKKVVEFLKTRGSGRLL